jgi:hypothetical protein
MTPEYPSALGQAAGLQEPLYGNQQQYPIGSLTNRLAGLSDPKAWPALGKDFMQRIGQNLRQFGQTTNIDYRTASPQQQAAANQALLNLVMSMGGVGATGGAEGGVEGKFSHSDVLSPHRNLIGDKNYVYHGTNLDNARDIQDIGSLRTYSPQYGTPTQREWPDGSTRARSYWSSNPANVGQFTPTEGQPVVIRAPKRAAQFQIERGTGDIYTHGHVPLEHLQILTRDGWKALSNMTAGGEE